MFAKPAKIARSYATVLSIPNQLGHARLGIIVGKQQVKRAVDRNRLRRIARESFRQHKAAIKALDIVLLLRSECVHLNNKTLREKIDNLWSHI